MVSFEQKEKKTTKTTVKINKDLWGWEERMLWEVKEKSDKMVRFWTGNFLRTHWKFSGCIGDWWATEAVQKDAKGQRYFVILVCSLFSVVLQEIGGVGLGLLQRQKVE